ncbi:MAG: SsrA-binding protein SmpB [Endomicrobia bacterium]|nr:SsrA-binding protein SmpB [Endomicrobiia bacterium]MCL2507064.1 SsrA-binding protein SmpB [Endomicrobiia bacterium]
MEKKIFSTNRKAFHDYEILEKLEAGIVLSGYEVKSVRRSNITLVDGIVRFSNGEAFAENIFIAPYEQISTHISDYDTKRKRKLLMHKSEINRMHSKVKEKGLTVVPLEVYVSSKGRMKLLVGLAKGKRAYDKKETIKRKDIERETAREIRADRK